MVVGLRARKPWMVLPPEQRHLSYRVSSNGYRGVLVTRSRGSQPTDETTCSYGGSSCHHKHAGEDRVNILVNHRSRWYDLQTICLPALNYVTDWTVVYIGSTPLYGWPYIGGSDGKLLTIIELCNGASGYCNGSINGSVYMENVMAKDWHSLNYVMRRVDIAA